MPIKLAAAIYKTVKLDGIDKIYNNEGEATFVTVRQATQGQHEARQSLFSQLERKYNPSDTDEITLIQNFSLEELKREEVWLTLVDSNILNDDGTALFVSKKDNDGKPFLDMTRVAFNSAFRILPTDVATAIHAAVLEVNIDWSAEGEA